jgi:hypothetical protein
MVAVKKIVPIYIIIAGGEEIRIVRRSVMFS